MTISNPSFIPNTNFQWAWDSTSLGAFKTCPRKYYYTMIEQWRPRAEAIALTFGIAYHKGLELYDKFKAQGDSHDEAEQEVIAFAMKQAIPEGDTRRTRFTLARSLAWYLEQFKNDPCETVILADGRPAVELSFRLELHQEGPTGKGYILCGHLDRLVNFNGALWVMDRKTTGSALSTAYFSNFNPDNQMSQYTFAANIVTGKIAHGVIIDAAQLAVGFTRFQRAFTQRTPNQLEEWLQNTLSYIRQAERCAECGDWPMNDSSCSKFGGCPFRSVCSKDPSVRETFLRADFEKRIWNPLECRE
jgi:hypothetical protein